MIKFIILDFFLFLVFVSAVSLFITAIIIKPKEHMKGKKYGRRKFNGR